jgi:predicted nucleic acid-binding protein
MIILEPVLGETCNFLRNHARKGPWLEARLLHAITGAEGDFTIENPLDEDRARAAQLTAKLVDAPFGYVDSMVLAMAERMHVPDIATVDYKMLGMAGPVSRLKPLNWVLQNYGG